MSSLFYLRPVLIFLFSVINSITQLFIILRIVGERICATKQSFFNNLCIPRIHIDSFQRRFLLKPFFVSRDTSVSHSTKAGA